MNHRCGHVQRPNWSGGQPGRRLSCQCMPIRRFRSASAPPMSMWIAMTIEIMGWGTQALDEHETRNLGILPWSGTPRGSWMALHCSRSAWGGGFCPLIERQCQWGIEKFIIRQPPIGEKDDYDSENSWISDGLQQQQNEGVQKILCFRFGDAKF